MTLSKKKKDSVLKAFLIKLFKNEKELVKTQTFQKF